ncbi:lactonase family protein [Streptomyces iconiensis]|uniref:Lactonase family protein n=1 Tax=Streptomyces iconiensis TaxID=1384038 RepID=A0ABT7A7D8_9ACTN|nr:lactonase family protein [Streptomyces iconiensis]MDJ1137254.1 lactonase family protein [Streptomyces iconiensis]
MAGGADTQQRAYIGSFTSAGGRGITTAALDVETGALTALHHTDAVPDPSFLTLAPDRAHLYAVSEQTEGGAAAFSLGAGERAGGPAQLGATVPVDGSGPTHVALAAGCLYTANYTSGNVSALRVRADGALEGPASTHQHEGQGPDKERQEGPHAHAVVPDPSGRWLLSVDLGTDSVWIYDLQGTGPGPHPHREIPFRAGSGPRHLAFPPAGATGAVARAYVINELDSTVTACSWDAARGDLEPLGETRILPPERTQTVNQPSALTISPDGRFAWAANRGDDSVSALALDTGGGLPERVTTVPCGGHWPRDLAVHPSGRWLYAANERSGDVTWFEVDRTAGMPHRAGSLAAPAASCVVFG